MTCQNAIELLPWFVNNTLNPEEQAMLLEHLAVCESCRSELEATGEAWRIFDQHVPSFDLVEYALGQELCEIDRKQIEGHLATCPSCRAEVDLIVDDNTLVFASPNRPRMEVEPPRERSSTRPVRARHAQVWRSALLAASLTAALASGYLLSSVGGNIRHDGKAQRPQVMSAIPTGGAPAPMDPSMVFSDGFESSNVTAWSVVHAVKDFTP